MMLLSENNEQEWFLVSWINTVGVFSSADIDSMEMIRMVVGL